MKVRFSTVLVVLAWVFAWPVPADATGGKNMIEVCVGETFNLTLDSNITTGFSWRMPVAPAGGIVVFLGSKYLPPSVPRLGAGGREVWSFRALKTGQTRIRLDYVRPWEKDVPPAATEVYRIVVKPSAGEGI